MPSQTARSVRLTFLILCAGAAMAQAQAGVAGAPLSVGSTRQYETREQIEAKAQAAERRKQTSEAWLLRQRLERGDFQEGDRILITLDAGTQASRDTLQVRAGKMVQFPQMGELSLNGVLRSELNDRVREHLARYLNTPVVRATPLLPIAVMGSVVAQGYYNSPADVVLRDVIMRAGGPTGDADLSKVVIRRGGEVIWAPKDVAVALSDGLTLDGLHLRAGDEVFVPRRRSFQMGTLVAILSSTVALTVAIVNLMNQ